MKACQISPVAADGALHRVDLPRPVPGQGEVLVRVRAASLNYRDLLVAQNVYGATLERVIPLSDGAGEVAEVGPGVTGLKAGDRVAGAFYPDWVDGPITAGARVRSLGANMEGMLAEYVVLPAHAAIPIPDYLTWEEAATLPCAALTAWHALSVVANVRPGDTVLLQGTGGVSMFALQFARIMGARVIQTSGDAAKRARVAEMGADAVIDYKAEPDWDRPVMDLTGGRGADVVIEVGGPGTLERSFRAVRVGGTIVSIGFVGGGAEVNPRAVIGKSIRLQGLTVGSCAMFRDMNRALALHELRPVIDRVFPFEEAAAAYAHLRAGAHFGKIVIAI